MKKTISIIATGGTIASEESVSGIKPSYKLNEMLENVPEIHEIASIRPYQLMNKDSANMQPGDWIKIAMAAYKELKYSDGVVITHGTDTMAYTASALSFMLQNLNKPVILTGSQRSWNEKNTDAKTNLMDAVKVIASCDETKIKGVHIVFHGKIIMGCRAKKSKHIEKTELDAFETVNFPLVGLIENGHIMLNPLLMLRENHDVQGDIKLDTRIDEGIMSITLTPGFDPCILESIKDKCKALIIQAYGLGDMPVHGKGALIPAVRDWINSGKILAITSQACYETDLSRYEVGKEFLKLGVIPTLDMTHETAYAKLMWILGHTKDADLIKKMMWTNYIGEIWPLKDRKQKDLISEMARYYDLTRRLFESNTELMGVIKEIFEKVSKQETI